MVHLVLIALTGLVAAAQQPQVQEQELGKPGQAQIQQPAKPVPAQQQPKAAPAPEQKAQAPSPQPTQPAAPQAAPVPAAANRAGTGQHVLAPEETERGQQGKPVAAFWTVIPGK